MTDVRSAFRLQAAVGALGALATLGALIVAGSRLSLAPDQVRATCDALLSAHDLMAAIALTLTALGALVVIRALTALLRCARAHRRLKGALVAQDSIHGATIVAGHRPAAFCCGLVRPRAYVTRGAVERLSDDELRQVIAHERHHVRRRDPLRLALGRSAAYGLFYLPVLGDLLDGWARLSELAADDAASSSERERDALARAMLTFDEWGTAVGDDRIDNLCGDVPAVSVPLAALCVAGTVLTALVAATVAVGAGAGQGSFPIAMIVPHASLWLAVVAAPAFVVMWARRRGADSTPPPITPRPR